MPYDYQTEKQELFTERGQVMFLKIRDNVKYLLKQAGAVRMAEAINNCGGGNSWTMLACVDRLVELKEIVEITAPGQVAGQYRVFVKAYE